MKKILMFLLLGLFFISFTSATITTTLNSPIDNYILLSNPQTFNASAEVTGGAILTNISLFTNESGSWGLSKTKQTIIDNFDDGIFNATLWQNTSTSSDPGDGMIVESSSQIKVLAQSYAMGQYGYGRFNSVNSIFQNGNTTWIKINNIQTTNENSGDSYVKILIDTSSIIDWNPTTASTLAITDIKIEALSTTQFRYNLKTYGSWGGWITKTYSSGIIYFQVHQEDEDGSTSPYTKIEIDSINHYENITDLELALKQTLTDTTLWNVQACDSDGNCGFSTANRTLSIDSTKPQITTDKPTEIINYGTVGQNETLNVTFTDTNLDSCWYDYNGTNTTIEGCLTGVSNQANFTLEYNNYNMTLWANDSVGNYNSTFIEWEYQVLENSRTHNTTTYETAAESYSINVTANSSLTAVSLNYNGTYYPATQSGTVWTYLRDVPTTALGDNSIDWRFTYSGATIDSDYSTNQNVAQINLTYCTSGTPYINFTFKDESDDSLINATIPTSIFNYYLGAGTEYKTLTYINTTPNYDYSFCFTPNTKPLNLDYRMQYESTDYPQRISEPETFEVTNATTNKILYLLGTTDGIYVTFQVINIANQLISGVDVTATREIESEDVIVGTGTTGASGSVTFWLNPDFQHDFSFSKIGYTTYEYSEIPTQNSYTITLSGDTSSTNSSLTGIKRSVRPSENYLLNDTVYTFAFNLTSSLWDVSSYGFNLRLTNGTIFSGGSTGVEGTELTLNYNSTNQSTIYMDYWWIINDEYTNATVKWLVFDSTNTNWSLAVFFEDLEAYLDSGIFGLDDFGRILIVFLILFVSVGIMSYKYRFTSPMAITTLIFGMVFFLDVVTGLLPDIGGMSNLPTFLAGLVLVLTIMNEVRIR